MTGLPIPGPEDPTTAAQASTAARRPGLTPVSLFLVLLIAYVLIKIQFVLVLTILALLFATIIERPVLELEKHRLPRPLSILTVYVAIIGSLVLLSVLIAPVISDEADTFRAEAPDQLRELERDWRRSGNPLLSGAGADLLSRAIRVIQSPPEPAQDTAVLVLTNVAQGVVGLVTMLVMAFYYLMEKSLLRRLILGQLQPRTRDRVDRVWENVEAQVGRWMRGQITLMLIIGVTATIGYGAMGIRFWPLLGLVAGLTEALPIIGPWLGGIPAVIIAMTQSWEKALLVAGFIIVLQLTENWILVPRVMRGAVGLTPLTVFVAILAGTEFMNVVGALLAIPVAAAVQVIVTDYLSVRRQAGRSSELSLPGWRWMRGTTYPAETGDHRAGESRQPSGLGYTPAPPPPAPPERTAPAAAGWTNQLLARVAGHVPDLRRGHAPDDEGSTQDDGPHPSK